MPDVTELAQRLSLSEGDMRIVLNLLKEYAPGRPVWAFGSRTFGRARRLSDLDLAVGGGQRLSAGTHYDLVDGFDLSDLPIEVDVVDLGTVTPEFLARIEPDFVLIQQGEELATGTSSSPAGLRLSVADARTAPLEGAR